MDSDQFLVTRRLREFLEQAKPEEFNNVLTYLEKYAGDYDEAKKGTNGPSAVWMLQHDLSENIKKRIADNNMKVSCGSGCFFCCYLHVDITMDEALLLVQGAIDSKIELNWSKIKTQSIHGENTWDKLPYNVRRCVFLSEEGKCNAYDKRPMSCRKYFTITPVEACDTSKGPISVLSIDSPHAEALVSVACQKSEFGSMAKMLLKAKKELEKSNS